MAKPAKIPTVPYGETGGEKTAYDGIEITNEFLTILQGLDGSRMYHKMSNDAQASMVLNSYKNPIRSCEWGFKELDEKDKQGNEVREVLTNWFFNQEKRSFTVMINQVLSFLEYGFASFERYYAPYSYKGKLYMMPKLDERPQVTISQIDPKKRIVKQVLTDGSETDIPFDNMVFFILNQRGNDWRGTSLLRPAYPEWRDKLYYKTILKIGAQRGATGIPHITLPAGTENTSKDYANARTLLSNLISHEKAYMITNSDMEFTVENINFNAESILGIIRFLDSSIALSVMSQFLLLGQNGGGGSYSLGEDQSSMFLDALSYVVSLIEEVFFRHVIRPTLLINWGDFEEPERFQLQGRNLNKKAGAKLSEMVQNYANSKFIQPTVKDEQYIRSIVGLPQLDKEEIDRRSEMRDAMDQMRLTTDFGNPGQPVPPNDKVNAQPKNPNPKTKETDPKKLAEQRQSYTRRQKRIADEQDSIAKFMRSFLIQIKDRMVIDVKKTLARGSIEIDGLKNISPYRVKEYRTALEHKLAYLANFGWTEMKNRASKNNIKLAEDLNPKDLKSKILKKYVENEADSIVLSQTERMKLKAINTAEINMMRGLSVGNSASLVSKVLDAFIESTVVDVASSYLVVGSINFGGNEFNRQIEDQLWGYRFVAIDDERTTQICRDLNGKTYSSDSPEMAMVSPPLHANCRSFMEPIYKTEAKPDQIDDYIPPPEVMKGKQF